MRGEARSKVTAEFQSIPALAGEDGLCRGGPQRCCWAPSQWIFPIFPIFLIFLQLLGEGKAHGQCGAPAELGPQVLASPTTKHLPLGES